MNVDQILDIFKVPPKIMGLVIRASLKFKAILMRVKAQKQKHMKLRLQTEADPFYENGRLLQLKGKSIKPVPNDLYTLTELTTLDMSASRESNLDCLLDKLPVELVFLKNLRCLHIDVNNISIIPVEIGELVNLEKLTCTNNRISCLPSSFKKLEKLRSLHLANNAFEHFPIIVCSLVNLKFLDFSNNELTIVPEQIGDLINMEIFLLFHNLLEGIPESMCTLTKLKTLWLGDNKIQKLPKNIINLKNLDWESSLLSSNIGGNPLIDPPIEICEKGVKAISTYYRAIGRRKSSFRDIKRNSITAQHSFMPTLNESTRRPSLRNFKFKNELNEIQENKLKKPSSQQEQEQKQKEQKQKEQKNSPIINKPKIQPKKTITPGLIKIKK